MPRPPKERTLSAIPRATLYLPTDADGTERSPHEIAIEDFEVQRLVDGHGLQITEAAARVGVSKSTAGRMLERARRSLAIAIENRAPLYLDASQNLRLKMPPRTVQPPPVVHPNRRIAIAVDNAEGSDHVSRLFGRTREFLIVNDALEITLRIPNPGSRYSREAASAALSAIGQHDVTTAIAGRFGPDALEHLSKAKIEALPFPGVSVDALLGFLKNQRS